MSSKETVKVRNEGLDKFYTKTETSKKCIEITGDIYEWDKWDLVLEPSAGNGSFYKQIPVDNKYGLDISPEDEDLVKMDFFDYNTDEDKVLTIGNPPFGRSCSLAIKFFNHASKFSDVIAFIIPRTFRRISVHNQLNLNFHLIKDEELSCSPCCFEPKMSVKCCFQIWERRDYKRDKINLVKKHKDWEFLAYGPKDDNNQPTPPDGADFAIRAYGGNCGEIVTEDLQLLRPKSWHFIKSNIGKEELISILSKLDYSFSKNTARQNSIGKGELVLLYTTFINSIS